MANSAPPRRASIVLGIVAGVAVTLVIAFAVWNSALLAESDQLRTALQARAIPLPDGSGRLHVESDGDATLVVDRSDAPSGKDYELWVIEDGTPRPAGVFDDGRSVVRLTRRVPEGGSVAMTIEPDGGVDAPTARPLFVVSASEGS